MRYRPKGYGTTVGPLKDRPVITQVSVESSPSHEHISVWNRGGLAGNLTVERGDGDEIAKRLMGERRPVAVRYRRSGRSAWSYADWTESIMDTLREVQPDEGGEIEVLAHLPDQAPEETE